MLYYYSHAYLTTPFCRKFSTLAPPEEIPSYATVNYTLHPSLYSNYTTALSVLRACNSDNVTQTFVSFDPDYNEGWLARHDKKKIEILNWLYSTPCECNSEHCKLFIQVNTLMLHWMIYLPCRWVLLQPLELIGKRYSAFPIIGESYGTGFELPVTVCNVQFAHCLGPNSENCISLFKTMCKFAKKSCNIIFSQLIWTVLWKPGNILHVPDLWITFYLLLNICWQCNLQD